MLQKYKIIGNLHHFCCKYCQPISKPIYMQNNLKALIYTQTFRIFALPNL